MTTRKGAADNTPRRKTTKRPEVQGTVTDAEQRATPPNHAAPDNGDRARIAARAYALYEERGYRQGCELHDWLDAEREILSRQPPS